MPKIIKPPYARPRLGERSRADELTARFNRIGIAAIVAATQWRVTSAKPAR